MSYPLQRPPQQQLEPVVSENGGNTCPEPEPEEREQSEEEENAEHVAAREREAKELRRRAREVAAENYELRSKYERLLLELRELQLAAVQPLSAEHTAALRIQSAVGQALLRRRIYRLLEEMDAQGALDFPTNCNPLSARSVHFACIVALERPAKRTDSPSPPDSRF